MGTLQVQVNPFNPGNVTVRVWMSQYPPTRTPVDESITVNSSNPLNKTWQLDSGLYSVTISWKSGYQNIASGGGAGNMITVNGKSQYYQVLGNPANGYEVMANFGYQV